MKCLFGAEERDQSAEHAFLRIVFRVRTAFVLIICRTQIGCWIKSQNVVLVIALVVFLVANHGLAFWLYNTSLTLCYWHLGVFGISGCNVLDYSAL